MAAAMKSSNRWLGVLGAAAVIFSTTVLASSSSSLECIPENYANGECDPRNNTPECGYDSGDCCACTCEDTNDYTCGENGGFRCIDPDAPCVNGDDVTLGQVETCDYPQGIGDGYCDNANNNALCDYDGGDCCECTCTKNNGGDGCYEFQCVDPAAECVDDDDITVDQVENCGYVPGIGDGHCHADNNIPECKYDGGDCCECTCVAPERTDDYDDDDYFGGCGGHFACIDPNADCVNDDDITIDLVGTCDTVAMSDAICDGENNTPECNYDGGDCCPCTCEDTPSEECGQYGGFACIDPEAPCVDDDDVTVDMFEACSWVGGIGDGYCDEGNNIEACRYDGGDCCACTCDPTAGDDDEGCGRWSNFACIDPMAPCVDDDSVTIEMVDVCDAGGIGNGYCEPGNNVPECAFDGGDCCPCTCESPANAGDDDSSYACQYGFACVDPSAPCVNDDDITVGMFEECEWITSVGDGYCNLRMNTPECNYDGGDCCECTCEVGLFADDESGGRYAGCNEFACIDPDAPCVDDDSITIDMIENCDYVLGIGNGFCDRENNNELCAFDGGDCCSCTCEYEYDDDYACSTNGAGFDCKDPDVPCFGEEKTKDDDDDFDSYDDDYAMPYEFVPWEQEGPLPTVDGAVEAGTKTEVGVTATAYDVRPGRSSNMAGCGEDGGDGCAPANSRDGIASEMESRWSCAAKLVEGGGSCQIEYTFAEPQDIVDIQVAFWKGNERIRTLDVHLNGEMTHTHESHSESTFNTLGVAANGVTTVTLVSTGLTAIEWISLIEVLIFVKPDPLPTVDGAVEVGTKTEVAVTATAYDVRPGNMSGCGEEGGDGCAPAKSHDGIAYEVESRWSCATKLVEGGGSCQIEYTFAEPQDIMDIQVAFWKGNERTRTLGVHLDGVRTYTHESYAGSTFNTLGVSASGASTVMLTSVDLLRDEWISLVEVLIFVSP